MLKEKLNLHSDITKKQKCQDCNTSCLCLYSLPDNESDRYCQDCILKRMPKES